ncbi:LCP family protein [Pseudonocardia adelaidensis]|uniref:LCP family protein n=1 Tax=Pseudonocardia adelaidensis TaxID=648754 RepID=A0ABP9NB50_9PSEU
MNGRSTGRSTLTRPVGGDRSPAVPARRRPGADPPPPRNRTRPARPERATAGIRRRIRTALVVASALVMVLTGTAWGLYRDVTAGITTTDVISGGGDGGDLNILLVGVDSRTDAQGRPLPPEVQRMLSSGPDTGVLNSDTIILLHVPQGGGAATAFSIPRDAYVDIPGYRRDKINAAYPATKALAAERLAAEGVKEPEREAESAKEGRTALIRTVENLTGQTIDHYAEVNLLGFYNLTTAIGGVDVCLRKPVDEPLSGAHFPAGPQTIAGTDALAFVRQRHDLPDGDLSRIRRQQVFLAAVADKILAAGTLTDPGRLGALVGVAQQSLVIDEGWDLLGFARQAADLAAGNLQFVTIPTEGRDSNSRGDVVIVEPRAVEGFVEQRISEQAQAAQAAAAAAEAAADVPPPPPDLIASRYVVDVRNGSDLGGMAASVADHLRGLGFARGIVTNTHATDTSVVRYAGPDADAARAVAEQLGDISTENDGSVARGHLNVVLGADFDPAVVPAPADGPPAPTPTAEPEPTEPITAAGVPCID